MAPAPFINILAKKGSPSFVLRMFYFAEYWTDGFGSMHTDLSRNFYISVTLQIKLSSDHASITQGMALNCLFELFLGVIPYFPSRGQHVCIKDQ